MTQPDLTPSTYIKRSQTRAAVRLWSFITVGCAVIAGAPVSIEMSSAPDPTASRAQERYAQATARVEQSTAEIQSVSQMLRQHERELQAEEHLTRRPDWSAVLRLVAGQFDQNLVMTGFELGGAGDSGVRQSLGSLSGTVSEDSVWLILTGVAEANSHVPGLILRLEGLGLFDRVVMTGTQREPFAGGQRTGFTLACRVQ